MLALVLFLFGVVFMPIIAVLFLTYIVLGKLSYTWFLEVVVNDVAEAGIPAPQATVKKVLMFHRPSNQSHENVDLLRPEIDHPDTCRFVAEAISQSQARVGTLKPTTTSLLSGESSADTVQLAAHQP
jgi:hypothetical protein